MTVLFIFLGIIVVAAIWFAFAYNHLVRLATHAKEAWADIDVQLKRRYELIPNLVNTVKGYASHEIATFENITKARSEAMNAGNVEQKSVAENTLAGALKSVFAIAEAYPDLKANTNFLELQRELSDTENKIQAARRFFNTNVRDLNITVDSFPSNFVANVFHFEKMAYFELSDAETAVHQPVEVKF